MPAARMPTHVRRPARAAWGLLFAGLLLPSAFAQPPAGKQGAVKLPDGTIIIFSKTPDAADPPVDGVLLTPEQFNVLTEQAARLKRLADAPPTVGPSRCIVRGAIEPRGAKAVAALTVTIAARTTVSHTVVLLGLKGGFPVAAKQSDGRPPLLAAGPDGLTATFDAAGDHELTLTLDVPITARGPAGEPGFELGLPKAAITTLALTPPAKVPRLAVGVRSPGDPPGEAAFTTVEAADLNRPADRPGYPLGPAEAVTVRWEPPTAPGPAAPLTADTDVTVRVDENQVETTATLKLRGPAKEWTLILPAGATATVERPAGATPLPPFPIPLPSSPKLTDAGNGTWTLRPPEGGPAEWTVTVTARRPRPPAADPAHRGPYPVGPFAVPTAVRQTVSVVVHAPPTVRLRFASAAEVRRSDSPPEKDAVAAFKWTAVAKPGNGKPGPLLTLDARRDPGFVRAEPAYTLRFAEAGWRLTADLRVTPVRAEVSRVLVDVPAGWQDVEASPVDLVDEVEVVRDGGPVRRLAVKLTAPQKAAFDLTLSAVLPVSPGSKAASIPLPRVADAVEANARLTATVPTGAEVHGSAVPADGSDTALALAPTAGTGIRSAATVAAVGGRFDKGVSRVELKWDKYRPELPADIRAEVLLGDRQATITETIRFRPTDPDPKPITLRGPAGAIDLRAPGVKPAAAGEWVFTPVIEPGKEVSVTLRYALPVPPRRADGQPARFAVGLLWPTEATTTEATVRVWGAGSGRRVGRADGPWRELPPEPAADRDTLPWLTLAGSGTGSGTTLPLTLDLTDPADPDVPTTSVDRGLVQAWLGDGGAVAVRGRFLLRRWSPTGVAVELPPGVLPDVYVDGKRAEVSPSDGRAVRVPVPAFAAIGRPGLVLDVRYTLPPGRGTFGLVAVPPPVLQQTEFRGPVRWQLVCPTDCVLLAAGRDLTTDLRWGWRGAGFGPVAAATPEELEHWLSGGADPDTDPFGGAIGAAADALTARQPALGPVRVVRLPRLAWVAGCSGLALAVGLVVVRLRPRLIGPVVSGLGVAAAVAAAGWPHAAAQAVAAAQPGLAALLAGLGGLAAVRAGQRWRARQVPGFSRTLPAEPPSESAARSSKAESAVVPFPASGSGSGTAPYTPAPSGS